MNEPVPAVRAIAQRADRPDGAGRLPTSAVPPRWPPDRGHLVTRPPSAVEPRGQRLPVLPVERWRDRFRTPTPEDHFAHGEQGLLCTRRHWVVPLIAIIGSKRKLLISMSLAVVLMTIGYVSQSWWILMFKVLLVVVHQIYIIYCVVAWRLDVIVGTDRQLLRLRGVFTRTGNAVELERIKERYIHRSIPGRILGYGTIQLITSDGSEKLLGELSYVPNPMRIYRATL